MSRQSRTLIFGAVLCLVLAVLSFSLRVPYLVESPGPTYNTLGQNDGKDIILVTGRAASQTSGHLNLMTVLSDTDKTTIAGAMEGWLRHDQVVVPYDAIYPPGTTKQQQNTVNAQDFTASQDNATAAAACELGYPKGFGVISVASDSPNRGVLDAGDRFVSVDGTAVTGDPALRKVVTAHKAGDKLSIALLRGSKPVTVTAVLGPPASGSTSPRLGVTVATGCLLPFEVDLTLPGIGGPSAGLMFSLGIIDKISSHDLTHGKFIAGTGTIDPSGAVGQIGGIALKMIAARRAGATVFLAPASNCADVKGNIPSGLDVVKVSTLHEAISSLDALAQGGAVQHC
ncbi:MAG: PDZ domain-containing protein [Actinomycetota bacterium]|nr:PDZ domain-containing protein [Actinomycetota bacterium]